MSTTETHLNIAAMEQNLQQQDAAVLIAQVASQDNFSAQCAQIINPWAAEDGMKGKLFKSLDERKGALKASGKSKGEQLKGLNVEQAAKQFEATHPEVSARSLQNLLRSLNPRNPFSSLLKEVQKSFPDPTLTDYALEFLIDHSPEPLKSKLMQAKEQINQQFGRQIVAGRNIAQQATEFSKTGLGSTTALRDLYRDITGNPREPATLFEELSKQYPFAKLKTVIQFMLNALGGDLRSKGPSIEPAELVRLFSQTRVLQSILGVYRFFQSREPLLKELFAKANLPVPPTIGFEVLSRLFMHLLDDRFPNAAKVRQLEQQLGLPARALVAIALISQWRDAVRNISPRLYRNQKHRDDLFTAIVQCLDTLEDEAEEEEEEEEKEKRKALWKEAEAKAKEMKGDKSV